MQLNTWLKYFENNKKNQLVIPKDTYELSQAERERISASIQSFQLGESSEGNVLRAQAKVQSLMTGEPCYSEAIEHLIREENLHSSYLGQFMRQHSIPKIKQGWNDKIFRCLRTLAGIELSSRVLVTAEVIAMTYYECLGQATQSPVLRMICERMCAEEKAHVDFQMYQIHKMNFQKHALQSSLANILHFALLLFTFVPVWLEHQRVLKIQYSFSSFVKKVWHDFQEVTYQGQLSAARELIEVGFISKEALCI